MEVRASGKIDHPDSGAEEVMLIVSCPNPHCPRKSLRVDPATLQAARDNPTLRVRCRRCRTSFVLCPEKVQESSDHPSASKRSLRSKMRSLFALQEPDDGGGSDVVAAADHDPALVPSTGQPEQQPTADYTAGACAEAMATVGLPPPLPNLDQLAVAKPPMRIGRFEIRTRVGAGGFGTVYRAYDPHLERYVALKVPREGTVDTPQRLQRFLGEARSAAQLRHPHIVPIYDAGSDSDQPYIASAFIEGRTLGQACDEGQLDLRRKVAIVRDLAEALAYAHSLGIIHRDVKPANILLDSAADCHLTDFGLACRYDASGQGLEAAESPVGGIAGTPTYMSPEHWRARAGDIQPASDQYSLGVVLYELLCGQPPFDGPLKLLRYNHESRRPDAPRTLNPQLPRDLETICLKTLAKRPQDRYAGCRELADDLRRWLEGEPIKARRLGPIERSARWCRREPALATALGFAMTALLAFGISMLLARNQERRHGDLLKSERDATRTAQLIADANAVQAETNAVEAGNNAKQAQRNERTAQRNLLGSRIDEALNLCERGEVGQGLVRLAQARQLARDADAGDFLEVIDYNLSGWRRQLHALTAVLRHPRKERMTATVYSPSGRLVATASGKEVRLWDGKTAKPHGQPLKLKEPVIAAAFGSEDSVLLVAGVHQVSLWDLAQGRIVAEISTGAKEPILAAALSPDGKTVLVGGGSEGRDDGWARLCAVPQGRTIDLFGREPVHALAFSRDGTRCVTGGGNRFGGIARLWEVHSGRCLGEMTHNKAVWSAAFSPDAKYLLTGTRGLFEGAAQLWDVVSREKRGEPLLNELEIYSVAFSPDGSVAAIGGQDRTVRLFDLKTRRPIGSPLRHGKDVNAVAFSPDGRSLLTGSDDGTARLWQLSAGQVPMRTCEHLGPVLAAAFRADRKVFVTGSANLIGAGVARVWDGKSDQPLRVLRHPKPVSAVAWSTDGRYLLTGSWDRSVRLWDMRQENAPVLVPIPEEATGWVQSLAFSPEGERIAVGWRDGWLWIGDTKTHQKFVSKKVHLERFYALAFDADGNRLVTTSHDQTARQWDARSGKEIGKQPLRHPDAVLSVVCSADGKQFLTGYAGGARLWDVENCTSLGPPLQHMAGVFGVAFGRKPLLITGGTDKMARLWHLDTRKPLGSPLPHGGAVMAVDSDPHGATVLTASLDGKARLWRVPAPIAAKQERLALWTQIISGIEVGANDVIGVLEADEWEQRRQELEKVAGAPSLEEDIRKEVEARPLPIIPNVVPLARVPDAEQTVRKLPAVAILDVDVRRLLAAPMIDKGTQQKLTALLNANLPAAQSLLKNAGITLERDIDRITLIANDLDLNADITAFVHGRFDRARIQRVLSAYAKDKPERVRIQQDEERTVYTFAQTEPPMSAAFADEQTLVVASSLAALQAALTRGEAAVSLEYKAIRQERHRLAEKEFLWLAVLMTDNMKKYVTNVPGLENAAAQLRAITATMELQPRGVGLDVAFHATDRKTANAVEKVLRQINPALFIELVPKQVQKGELPLVRIKVEGNDTILRLFFNNETLRKLLAN